MSYHRLKRTLRAISRIGYWKLINDAEEIAPHHEHGGRLRQALGVSGCDDGVSVYEWYSEYWPERLGILSGAFLPTDSRAA